jgi:hypothetical protein
MKRVHLLQVLHYFLIWLGAMALAATALAQRPSPVDTALRDMSSQDLLIRDRGVTALLAQSGVNVGGASGTRVRVANLLHNHPERSDQIKAGLIAALETLAGEYETAMRYGQELPADFDGYRLQLTEAVGALQDSRAVKALLSAGGEEGLADICPAAVDAIIERIHEPDSLDKAGMPIGERRGAVVALGYCLQRPALMQANPDVEAKVRRELLADLDDPDWSVRSHAGEALIPLRTDPEVRAKLQVMAATDPYVNQDYFNNLGGRYLLRDGASFILGSDAFSFFATRTPETRSCRVQPASEAPVGEQIIGPETSAMVRRVMCSHYDPTGQELSMCWLVEPANACQQ